MRTADRKALNVEKTVESQDWPTSRARGIRSHAVGSRYRVASTFGTDVVSVAPTT